MILVSEEINCAAWKIVRGYFASGLSPEYRKTLRDWVAKFKTDNPHASIKLVKEACLARYFAYSISYEAFLELYKDNLLRLAADNGIGQVETYHLYIVSLLDYAIVGSYPESPSFYDAKYSDEQLLNFAYRFIIGFLLNASPFTLAQLEAFRSILLKNRESDFTDEEVLEMIIEWSNDGISIDYFRKHRSYLLEIARLGDLSEDKAFGYYKVLFAHLVYKLAADKLVNLKN